MAPPDKDAGLPAWLAEVLLPLGDNEVHASALREAAQGAVGLIPFVGAGLGRRTFPRAGSTRTRS